MVKHLHKGYKKHKNVKLFYDFANHLTIEKEFAESFIQRNRELRHHKYVQDKINFISF